MSGRSYASACFAEGAMISDSLRRATAISRMRPLVTTGSVSRAMMSTVRLREFSRSSATCFASASRLLMSICTS